MAISEKRYAAEMVNAGGATKFDNIDCMVNYVSKHGLRESAAAWFVMDSEGREWLDARRTLLVKSESIPGPMGGGTLAVVDPVRAEQLARHFSGHVLHFEDLWKK
jgi:nitrous oxide reductase accessory protein NosL